MKVLLVSTVAFLALARGARGRSGGGRRGGLHRAEVHGGRRAQRGGSAVATANGLVLFDTSTMRQRVLGPADGLIAPVPGVAPETKLVNVGNEKSG